MAEKKKIVLGASRTSSFPMLGFMMMIFMLWDAVKGYLVGGEDAPSLPALIVSIVLFGSGAVFCAMQTWRTYKAEMAAREKKAEEAARLAAEEAAQEIE